jgi:hypothetical protein
VSSQVAEIVKMAESGVATSVIQAHIEQSTSAFPPNADEIIYLHNHRVPAEIITAYIRRGSMLRAQADQAVRESFSHTMQPTPSPPAPTIVQPQVYTYVSQPAYPAYAYTYPSYVYVARPIYRYGWPSVWLSAGYYYRPMVRHATWYPRYHRPSVRYGPLYPRHFSGSVRTYPRYAARPGPAGHFGRGFARPPRR